MNILNKFLKGEKGITLIEVLAALALTGAILTAVGGLYISSFRGHNQTVELVNRQNDITIIRNYFKNELNNAIEVQILSSIPGSFDSNYNYIYLLNNSIILKNNNRSKTIANNIDSMNFEIQENNSDNKLYTHYLEYTIYNEETSSIILNNISEYKGTYNTGSVIKYKKP